MMYLSIIMNINIINLILFSKDKGFDVGKI